MTPPNARKRKPLSRREAVEVVLRQSGKCPLCNEKLQPDAIEYDHIHALALGGADDISNIRALCKSCHNRVTNGKKSTTLNSTKHCVAKVKRIARGGKTRRGQPIKSRGFDKTHSKKFSGEVVERKL